LLFRVAACALSLLVTTGFAQTVPQDQPPLWSSKPDAGAFEKLENDRLAAAQRSIDQVVSFSGSRTIYW
jgi:hypothetical protein